MEADQRRLFIDTTVVANVVPRWPIHRGFPRGNGALQHDLRLGRHLEVDGFATGQVNALAAVEAGEQPFRKVDGQGGGGGQNHQGVDADGDRHLQLLPPLSGFAEVATTASHRQPLHGHGLG